MAGTRHGQLCCCPTALIQIVIFFIPGFLSEPGPPSSLLYSLKTPSVSQSLLPGLWQSRLSPGARQSESACASFMKEDGPWWEGGLESLYSPTRGLLICHEGQTLSLSIPQDSYSKGKVGGGGTSWEIVVCSELRADQ